MCGICGLLQVGGGAPVNAELLTRMRDLIAHRGPDDAGSYVAPDGRVGLANRRLSIIDLSAGGHQPLANEDGTVWIAFNGEIYNYRELRPALLARGHVFASQSDTEVIVHLYEEYGADCVQHLRGMFAFAIWDARRQELFLARDRLGEKPLYYAHADGSFMFASEIKSLLANPALRRKVKPEALYHYLTFLTPPAPDTLFDGVQKLAAGHCAWIARDGSVRVHEYWNMFAGGPAPASPGDVLDQLRSTLRESIALRMISDVPFGVLLSGGIDSTTNLALMTELLKQPVRSFSIGYAGAGVEEYNELNFARAAAREFGAEHHEVIIGREDLMRFLPDMIYHQDEPIADPVCVPVHYVCKLARESGTKVVQVGEGADELFGGYAHWIAALRLDCPRRQRARTRILEHVCRWARTGKPGRCAGPAAFHTAREHRAAHDFGCALRRAAFRRHRLHHKPCVDDRVAKAAGAFLFHRLCGCRGGGVQRAQLCARGCA